ncbi:GNAT family N-acetyltransferase, partial [Actinoplanes sp. NPDC051633]|uniref:GNAT family N-acetyltransferase n=1 Tax=Actinoplanes sp. NPDC051633 TaxID=3155670 RepID=UPI003421B5CC
HIPDTPGYHDRLQEITGGYHDRFLALDTAVDAHHPREPHHHLAWIVVHPDRQGRGYGSALLHYHHTTYLDGDNGARLPAYLEATGERNQWLYKRHGYTSLPPFPIAPGAPYLRPMWRDPH